MFEKPFPTELKDEFFQGSNFWQRTLANEFNKRTLRTLADNPADYLMIDVADLRLGLFNLRFNDGTETKIVRTIQTEKIIPRLKEQFGNFDFTCGAGSDIGEEEWDFLVCKYAAELKKLYPVNKIIINRLAMASQYEADGKLVDFTKETGGVTLANRGLLLRLQDKLERNLKGCLILDNPPFPIIADPNHKLGLMPLHLRQDVYDWKMRTLQNMILAPA